MTEKKRILLVDDDREFLAGTRQILEGDGYEVFAAYDGAQGLATARQVRPDLILLDVMMASNTEGFDVSRTIQEAPELDNIPIVMMTGIRDAMKLPFGFEPDSTWLPVKAVLEKPLPPATLLAEVRKHLAAPR